MRYYPINEESARTAWNMNHFGEFRSDEPGYMASVDHAYDLAEEAASKRPSNRDKAFAMADSYAKKLAEWHNRNYRIDSMCPSVLISGPANFPIAKKEKQNRAKSNHFKEFEKIELMKERIKALGEAERVIKSDDDDAISKLNEKLTALIDKQEAMKAANAKARRQGKQAPYEPFTLANNNQNIRATRRRIEQLQATKQKGTTRSETDFMGERVEVIENTEAMRLQLVFDGKPADEVRTVLKKNGFKWSPKNGAWQRQLTNNARSVLRWMLRSETA